MERRETKAELRKRVYNLIDRMSKRIGVQIPREQYPKIELTKKGNTDYFYAINTMTIPYTDIHSGETLGEEIAHFIRNQAVLPKQKKVPSKLAYYIRYPFRNELDRVPSEIDPNIKNDKQASEFLRYLGRKILQEIATPEDELKFERNIGNRKKILEKVKRIRKEKGKQDQERRAYLEHQRAYEFADALDLSNVADYSQLFSLPDKEVRYRFFRSDPQYDLNKPIQPGTITRRQRTSKTTERKESALETALKFIGTSGIFLLFIFSINIRNLTGGVIDIQNPVKFDYIAIIFFIIIAILAITGLLNYFKLKKRLK